MGKVIHRVCGVGYEHVPFTRENWEDTARRKLDAWTHDKGKPCWHAFRKHPLNATQWAIYKRIRADVIRMQLRMGVAVPPKYKRFLKRWSSEASKPKQASAPSFGVKTPKVAPHDSPGTSKELLRAFKTLLKDQKPNKDPMILVDGMNLVFRCHYAVPHLSHNGTPTGALHGFIHALRRLRKYSDRIVVCWDNGVPGDTRTTPWRLAFYKEYKANRVKSKDTVAIFGCLQQFRRVTSILGYGNAGIPGLEADDIISILTATLKREGNTVLIHSGDSDLFQLLHGEQVKALRPGKKGELLVTQEQVEKEYGITIAQWPLYLSLGGGHNNAHPFRGVGAKGAIRMVKLGANPAVPWSENPKKFRLAYPQCEEQWSAAQAVYKVSYLPSTLLDSRLAGSFQGATTLFTREFDRVYYEMQWARFTAFLVRFGLSDLLSRRREFF